MYKSDVADRSVYPDVYYFWHGSNHSKITPKISNVCFYFLIGYACYRQTHRLFLLLVFGLNSIMYVYVYIHIHMSYVMLTTTALPRVM